MASTFQISLLLLSLASVRATDGYYGERQESESMLLPQTQSFVERNQWRRYVLPATSSDYRSARQVPLISHASYQTPSKNSASVLPVPHRRYGLLARQQDPMSSVVRSSYGYLPVVRDRRSQRRSTLADYY